MEERKIKINDESNINKYIYEEFYYNSIFSKMDLFLTINKYVDVFNNLIYYFVVYSKNRDVYWEFRYTILREDLLKIPYNNLIKMLLELLEKKFIQFITESITKNEKQTFKKNRQENQDVKLLDLNNRMIYV